MSAGQVNCTSCSMAIDPADLEYANDPAAHPGVLGPVHPSCYAKMTDSDVDLPWTDPISGEVDYEAMQEDLGVGPADDGDDEFDDY